ncbi:MAG: hypothetical protein IKR17_02825 [Bacteroidales bacterium]|nr:hypothetical protein [Bacteroidales bacterium]
MSTVTVTGETAKVMALINQYQDFCREVGKVQYIETMSVGWQEVRRDLYNALESAIDADEYARFKQKE